MPTESRRVSSRGRRELDDLMMLLLLVDVRVGEGSLDWSS